MADVIAGIVAGVLVGVGVFFLIVAGIGIVRMPDLYTRMHATSKAGSLGVGLVLLAVAVYYHELGVVLRALAALTFLILTAPLGAHAIGRAAWLTGVKPTLDTDSHEIQGEYDPRPMDTPRVPSIHSGTNPSREA